MGGKGRYTLGEEMLLPQGPGNPPMQSVVGAFPDGEDLQVHRLLRAHPSSSLSTCRLWLSLCASPGPFSELQVALFPPVTTVRTLGRGGLACAAMLSTHTQSPRICPYCPASALATGAGHIHPLVGHPLWA